MSMKKTAALLLALCLMLLPVFGVSAEGQEACLLSDCERFAEDTDTLFEWGLFNNDDQLGELHLDTSSALQGQNSMRFDYDVWGAGGGWTRCIFFPDLQSMTVGDGLKFSAKATGNIKMYVVISIDWNAKWIPVTLTPEAREYTIIWDEAEEMKGTAPYSAKGATVINSLSFLIYDPCYTEAHGYAQFPTIQTKGSIWLDDLYTFVGEDTTDTDGKVFTAPKPTRPELTTTTTSRTTATKPGATTASEVQGGTTTSGPSGSQTTAGSTTAKGSAATTTTPVNATTAGSEAESGGVSVWLIIVIAVAVLAAGGAAVFFVLRRKKQA